MISLRIIRPRRIVRAEIDWIPRRIFYILPAVYIWFDQERKKEYGNPCRDILVGIGVRFLCFSAWCWTSWRKDLVR